ncbi:histidine phosphatase family protein [Ureibacillus manganicus]|uniref:Phosphatase n=1 Tax=Ureibacillus manganicus DSM 26584 TaxID=1384049 RepID=A0A0A3I0W8_9BACL|nr:histidine phosphatase family protein [Ureibacillus manganicus]KGR77150.1 hypothetical protein CD29_15755 [Ureibacillus manganicus DSM 26584]
MLKICLIRHGETDWNANGIIQGTLNTELNNRGKQQAESCATYLSKKNWDMIITSPLNRAKDTANIIANKISFNVEIMDEFMEKHYGEAVGSPLTNKALQDQAGEQFILFKKRVLGGLNRIIEKYDNKKILLVTHGDVIQVILTTLFQSNEYNIKVNNASLSEIEFNKVQWTINYFNRTNYL